MFWRKYSSLQSFFSFLSNYKLKLFLVFTSFVIADVALAIIPLFIGRLIGDLAARPVHIHAAMTDVVALIICSTAHDIFWHISEYLYMKLFLPVIYSFENIIFQQVIQKPYPYFIDKFTGKMSSYITTLSQELREGLERFFWSYASHVVSLVSVCILLFILNWQTGALFTISLILMLIVGRITVNTTVSSEKKWTDIQSNKNAKIIDAIANFVNIKSFRKEQNEIKAIIKQQNLTIKAAKNSFIWAMVFWGSMGFIVRNVLWPGTILLNVYLFMHHKISISELSTFLTAVVLFTSYVWDIIWSISQFTLKLARVEEAYTYLFGNTNIIKVERSKSIEKNIKPVFESNLTIKIDNFSYPDQKDETILKNINLSMKKGEKIGIVGKSGGGKTTLTKILLGYYPIENGQLSIDDRISDFSYLANLISYVPQDTSLFHRSIGENIAYAAHEAVDQEAIIRSAKYAHADEFIVKIQNGYDALVGERGVKLSAGQRQRIAIARAFLDNKPILILDEATSALDSESEILVQKALEALWQNKTVLAIAHRLSTLKHMDRIIVIDGGRIIEEGTHSQLLANQSEYSKLWNHQSGGFVNDGDSDV